MTLARTIRGSYWPEPIRVLSQVASAYGFKTIEAVGVESGHHYTTTLPDERWGELFAAHERLPTFRAHPVEFGLALEAQRLRLAYSCDPLLATNNALVHLLPHQIEAVYGMMLPQPTIRHLMAHDAGAGKTIMAGLAYKELLLRQPTLRTLIVAPAALTVQWQRELEEKFLAHFEIVGRDELRDNPHIWAESAQVITSLAFARQPDVQASLSSVSWDLIIVDEAHHLAAYETHKTLAYRLGEILSRQSRHLILATATPHKGDPQNFLKLLQLLDAGIYDPSIVRHGVGQRGSCLMLRRLKEEMVGFDGSPLFLPRVVLPRWHRISESPSELELYTALTEYVHKTYRAAERLGGRERVNVQFAMALLQRRMGSSFVALERSLRRRAEHLLHWAEAGADLAVPDGIEDLPEQERWEVERRAELATPARTREAREREAHEIGELLVKIEALRHTDVETKIAKLQSVLAEAGIAPGNGEKLLVFTEFKDTLDFLRARFEQWGYAVTQIDGDMPHELRRRAEREFRDQAQVMVATEAAGEGINLQFCARMVNFDLPWVPTRLEQRMGRIHRYGQKREVRIYNMAAADTREGEVLVGLIERLEAMRKDLRDQVFDVVSTLVSDVDLEQLLTQVALAAPSAESQNEALARLATAMEAGAARQRQWEEHPFAIDPTQFAQMQAASRQFRLTPEYAQGFFVSTLRQLKERPTAEGSQAVPPEDAQVLRVELVRDSVARALHVETGKALRLSFQQDKCGEDSPIRFVGLGSELFDGALRLAEGNWGQTLDEGAIFLDPSLALGEAYLLWFLSAHILDGNGQTVEKRLFAVRQTPESLAPAPASALTDLLPETGVPLVPQALQGLARDPQVVVNWSIQQQQLPYLAEAQALRARITALRRDPILADAQAALEAAQSAYDDLAFGGEGDDRAAEERKKAAGQRLEECRAHFEREAACSLGATEVVAVAVVLSTLAPPEADLADTRPEVAQAAHRLARKYEEEHGRTVRDVSGEHRDYPYDLLSSGPGGVRCIEVKGTTSGHIILSENERRAARRLGPGYYLYIVRDPRGSPRLTIIRDPLSKMTHDETLYSGVRYGYQASTWRAAADEEIAL